MRRRIADVFQEAADRELAKAEKRLPTDRDRQTVMEVARWLLDLDDELERSGTRKRSKCVTMASSMLDVAERQLAAAEKERRANRPTERDCQLFLEATRGFLDIDDELKRSTESRKRSKLIHRSIDTPSEREEYVVELRAAVERVANSSLLDDVDTGDDALAALAGFRIIMAYLIGKGLATQDRQALSEATKVLFVFSEWAKSVRHKIWGASRPHTKSAETLKKIKHVKAEAVAWRKSNPKKPKSEFYRLLFAMNRRLKIHDWKNAEVLRNWMDRNRIEV